MGITMSGLVVGFFCWLIIRRQLKDQFGPKAEAICLLCLGAGFIIGLWADGDTIRAIYNSLHRGSVLRY